MLGAVGSPWPVELSTSDSVGACSNDAGCANLDCQASGECDDIDEPSCSCTDPDEWACRGYQSDICLRTPNGSINTSCRRRCTTDQECKDLFGDPRYICQKLSGNQLDWGCLLPPATQDCPATVPAILDGTNLDLFACAATVGVNQESSCFKYEQGLRASLLALDPKGKNAEQSKAFLRDDAYLVIIYVSDEDDCSVADGRSISEDDYETCALLPTTDEGGPLVLHEVHEAPREAPLALQAFQPGDDSRIIGVGRYASH